MQKIKHFLKKPINSLLANKGSYINRITSYKKNYILMSDMSKSILWKNTFKLAKVNVKRKLNW